jgi:hypothetical protein
MNDRVAVEIIHGGDEAILELLLGCDADVAQDGAGEFGKEAMRRLTGEPGSGLFGDMRGMIVKDQLDRRPRRIGNIETLEEFDEFAAAMAILDNRVDLAGDEVDAGQQADRTMALIFMLNPPTREEARLTDASAAHSAAGRPGHSDSHQRFASVEKC